MSEPRLYLFGDRVARHWAPFTLTRPSGELLFGCLLLRERTERALGIPCSGHVSRAPLEAFDEPGAPPVVSLESVGTKGTRILLLSRVALDFEPLAGTLSPGRLTLGGRTVGWVLGDGEALPEPHLLLDPRRAPATGATHVLGGRLLAGPWELVARTPERIRADVAHLTPGDDTPEGVVRVGEGAISLAPGAVIEPGVVVDVRNGPVRLEEGARAEGPARLTGPLWIGPDSTVFGGSVGTSSIGPVCKVRGEVADSIFLGFANKAHDGHIGHAILGRWVNLGAGTTNSDLKNNYGPVRVWTPSGDVDTGLAKVGCFLGDHVKTGIGTVLNTGCVVGAGSNLFGGVMPPKVVPPFSWGSGSDLRDYHLGKFLEVAERAMARRDQELTPGMRELLERAWHGTRSRRDQ